MDNKNESQEFDLDDILNEFHDIPEEETAEVEPDEELDALLHMPELTITPVVVKEPEVPAELAEEAASEAPRKRRPMPIPRWRGTPSSSLPSPTSRPPKQPPLPRSPRKTPTFSLTTRSPRRPPPKPPRPLP